MTSRLTKPMVRAKKAVKPAPPTRKEVCRRVRVLLLCKLPMLQRVDGIELARVSNPVIDLARLRVAAVEHERSLDHVRTALIGHAVRERLVGSLMPGDADDVDVVVTVGGDGTVLTANTLRAVRPLITVNSDPARSVGHFARCRSDDFPDLFAAWLAGRAHSETVHRLHVSIDGGVHWRPFLNDCLFTSRNPAATTRYVLESAGDHEFQASSGVWVSTAAGSTAGIGSAGMPPVPADLPALLFQVREPFDGRGRLRLRSGVQCPPRGLRLAAAMPGIDLYLDGPHHQVPLRFGQTAEFAVCPEPLLLVVS